MFSEPIKRKDGVNLLNASEIGRLTSQYKNYNYRFSEIVKGKSICVVGPSPSLEGKKHGEFIDSHDLVVRINRGFPVTSSHEDIGAKTNILYHCLNLAECCGGQVHSKQLHEQNVYLACPYPKGVYPFDVDVFRFENRNKGKIPYHAIHTGYYLSCANLIGTRPNSGIGAILDLLCFNFKSLYITGFTFFRDGWRKDYKDNKKIFGEKVGETILEDWMKSNFNGNHFQEPQEDVVREIYNSRKDVDMDNTMKEILKCK